jgi:uncharacterized protein YgiM (DUF1202 family)
MKMKRKVRLPNYTLEILRNLSISYQPHKRSIPSLVTACLKQTRGKEVLKLKTTPRNDSEKIDITLDEEFEHLEHSEIAARIAHALIGIQGKVMEVQLQTRQTQERVMSQA